MTRTFLAAPFRAVLRTPGPRRLALSALAFLGLGVAPAASAAAQVALWTDAEVVDRVEVEAAADLVALTFGSASPTLRIYRLGVGFSTPQLEHTEVLDGLAPAVVALGPDHALVGDPGWTNAVGFHRGRVRVMRRHPVHGHWGTVQVLYPPVLGNVRFGSRVEVDGDRALIATSTAGSGVETGHVFAYARDPGTGTWTLEQELVPDYFPETNAGHDVSLDGDVAVLGDPRDTFPVSVGHGRVSVWRRGPGGVWDQEATLGPPSATSSFGRRVAVSGDDLVVLDRYSGLSGISPQPGRAYHFRRTAGAWVLAQVLSDANGTAPLHPLEVSLEGDSLVLTDDSSLPGFDDPRVVLLLKRPDPASPFQPAIEFHSGSTASNGYFGTSVDLEPGRLWVGEREGDFGVTGANLLNPEDGECTGVFWNSTMIVFAGLPDVDHDGVPDECQQVGSVDCTPDAVYTSGAPTLLTALGSDAVADDELRLTVQDGPPGAWGYALASTASANLPLYGGSAGLLCLDPGPSLARLTDAVAPLDDLGQVFLTVDLPSLPDGLGGFGPQPGDTWYFQYWFREGFESYYSNSVSVDFL